MPGGVGLLVRHHRRRDRPRGRQYRALAERHRRGARLRERLLGRPVVPAGAVPPVTPLKTLTFWALGVLGIPRLELYVEPRNEASIRTAERAGFRQEGLLRSWQEVGGERKDMLMYCCCRATCRIEDALGRPFCATQGVRTARRWGAWPQRTSLPRRGRAAGSPGRR